MKKIVFSLIFFLIVSAFSPAFAGDRPEEKTWEVYKKIGWFSWKEEVEGKPFIQDNGPIYALGIIHNNKLETLSLTETFELWGGVPIYNGHKMLTDKFSSFKSANVYFGVREEIRADIQIPIAATLSAGPFIGIDHKMWFRGIEGEIWNVIYAPIGMKVAYRFNKHISAFVEGGMTFPIITTEHVFMARQGKGFEDISLQPKAKIGKIARAGIAIRLFSVNFEYEAAKFEKSDMVFSKSLDGSTSRHFYQPRSLTSTTWLKIDWKF